MILNIATADPNPLTEQLAPVVMVVGVVLIGVLLTFSIRGKIARRNAAAPSAREMINEIKARAGGGNSGGGGGGGAAGAGTRDLVEISRQLAVQLDNKAERLEQLLAAADARIAELEAGQQHTATDAAPVAVPTPTPIPRPSPAGNGTAVQPPSTPKPRATPAEQSLDPLTRSVYGLADEGFSAVDIARHLDEQAGKIELILALRQDATQA